MSLLLLSSVEASRAYAQGGLEWHDFEEALAIADSTRQPVFIDVWAPWCGWCRKMKKEVYPTLTATLSNSFILTRLNRDDHSTLYDYQNKRKTPLRIAKQLQVQSVPAIILLEPEGNYLMHLTGFIEAEKLRPLLHYIAGDAYRNQTFERFKNRREL